MTVEKDGLSGAKNMTKSSLIRGSNNTHVVYTHGKALAIMQGIKLTLRPSIVVSKMQLPNQRHTRVETYVVITTQLLPQSKSNLGN